MLSKETAGVRAYYRHNGDERILTEVLEGRCYRRASDEFDIEAGEHWLDLGANIGAFALYCKLRKASADCFEPSKENFKVLRKNAPKFNCFNCAVTVFDQPTIKFNSNSKDYGGARGTVFDVKGYTNVEEVNNMFAFNLLTSEYDGIKLDIEGSEGPLIDKWLLPRAEKLVMEYHTSRDSSVANLKRRLGAIKRHYKNVRYPPEYDRAIASGNAEFKAHFDRMIFAWGLK